MNEEILRIHYGMVKNDWDLLQKYLEFKGNPKYILVGNVDLGDREDITNLGNLVGVEGYLWLFKSSIESLGDLEFVGGDLQLWSCQNIKTLGKLKKVEGELDLRFSTIESLGELEYVGGDFGLYKCQNIKTLGKLKKVEGDLNLNFLSIESLGDLEFVGGELYIRGTNIPQSELNNVEVVGDIYR